MQSGTRSGDREALDQEFALVYDEVHRLAGRHRRRWQGDHTLNTTALVHEAYVKLAGGDVSHLHGRAHLLALASRAMRQILCNHARAAGAHKRGGGLMRVTLDSIDLPAAAIAGSDDAPHMLLALDDALARLEEFDARQARVVECRFFGGLTVEETAAALAISPRTVKRDWQLAQAWLHREMTSGP